MDADLYPTLLETYCRTLTDLYRAGSDLIYNPELPPWFHTQRVVVANARIQLARFDPARHETARKMEAHALRSLCGSANIRARKLQATTRPMKRERRRLEAIALEWEELANQLLHGVAN